MPERLRVSFFLVSLIVAAHPAAAQPTIDPQYVEFTASADHGASTSDGAPLVSRYELRLFLAGAGNPTLSVSLGKPTPGAGGTIRLALAGLLNPLTLTGVYEVRIAAVGPTGTGESSPSNTFSFQPVGCAPSLSASGQSLGAAAGGGSVSVTNGSGCSWTASSNASWLAVTGGAPGSGSGTVTFSVAANASTSGRAATLTIAGLTFTVNQAGATGCSYAIAPGSASLGRTAGSSTVSVTAQTGCFWTSASNNSWISVTNGTSGSGNGSVGLAVAANTSTSPRTGTVTIAGRTFTLTQAGAACSYAATPGTQPVAPTGGTATVALTTQSGCAWTTVEQLSWVSITTGSSGTGSGTVRLLVAANNSSNARSATLTVGGRTVTITQGRRTAPGAPRGLRVAGTP